jgi:F-type H+-transporting ATPase subunit delta
MTNKTAATRYARALFDVALKEGADLQQIDVQLAGMVELFRQHPALEKVLLNPAVPAPRKRAAVADLTARLGLGSILAKLLVLLAERDRLVLLPDLWTAYRDRLMEHQRVVRAEVTTAVPLSPDRVQLIERRLAEVTGKRVNLITRTDPGIIGGLVARIGGTVYDGSVAGQLTKMRNRLAEAAPSGQA